MKKIKLGHYQVLEENGKYGLAWDHKVILKPFCGSLELVSDDLPSPPYRLLNEYENDPSVETLTEWDCKIVIADGKFGLVKHDKIISDLTYDRVIKLSFQDFLCKGSEDWTLFHYFGQLYPRATISGQDELTLEWLLNELAEKYPRVHKNLSEYLIRDSEIGQYISEYRRYTGSQEIGDRDYHYFWVSSDKVIIHNDFHTVYFRTDFP